MSRKSEQMKWLADQECTKTQGFLFHCPIRAGDFRKFLLNI
ncbi:MAG: hypothetical protein M0041_05315 [Nitrospiraceae bacterium]|nr:hypothetical protein [Nitrospiraceae bacterium]